MLSRAITRLCLESTFTPGTQSLLHRLPPNLHRHRPCRFCRGNDVPCVEQLHKNRPVRYTDICQQREEEESPDASPTPPAQRRRSTQGNAGGDDEDANFAGDGGATQDANVDEMAKKLVRLALACEYQRKPIRRQDVADKVLGTNNRSFKIVFQRAQLQLSSVFGMELVALPARETVTLQQRRGINASLCSSCECH